ncbi:unnamed protein product [Agarophyton chilense]
MEKFVLSARTGKCGTVLDVGAVALWLLNADWWVEFVRVAQLEVSDNQVQMEIIHVRSAPLELDTSPWETASEPGSLACEECPEGTFTYGGESECLEPGQPSAPVPFNDAFGKKIHFLSF